jgi:hypothetical protein
LKNKKKTKVRKEKNEWLERGDEWEEEDAEDELRNVSFA